jgi:DHA3 family macrolide efflux protein-like MFS transporter
MEDFKTLFKNRYFRYLWASQILSQLTINIMNFLLLIKLFNATGSTIATSFLWVAYALPAVFIGPIAAASVDLYERRKILIISNLLQSLTVFLYAFVHELRVFIIYGIAMIYSFLNQFYMPAEAASLTTLVKKSDYPQANGLFFLTQQASMIVGFGIAGVLNSFLGFRTSIFLCAIFLFLAFVSVTFLPIIPLEKEDKSTFEESFFKFFKRITEGYLFIKDNKPILVPFFLLMTLQVTLTIIAVNVPLIAKEIFNINVNSAGLAIIVPAGIGAAISSLFIPRLIKRGIRKKDLIEYALMLIVFTSLILIFLIPILNQPIRIILGFAMIVLLGLSFVGILIPSQTYLQEKTPGGLRGRVFGNYWFMVTIATIFPVIFSGTIVELFGFKLLFLLLGMMYLGILIISKRMGQKFLNNGIDLFKTNV